MSVDIERLDLSQFKSQELDTSPHGVVFLGREHAHYVEVQPDSPLLRHRSVGRLDKDTVVVSSAWDTRPVSDSRGFRPTQSDIVRKYIAEEQVLIKLVESAR